MKGSLLGNIARHTGRWIVIVFCLWHMTGVFAMSVPSPAQGPTALFLKDTVLPVLRPYLNWTSQWQSWDLFAPDPSNWITEERIEYLKRDTWVTATVISQDTVSEWRRADTLKIQQRIENEGTPLERDRFLKVYCVEHGMPENTPLRLMLRERTLSREDAIPKESNWSERETAMVLCPARL